MAQKKTKPTKRRRKPSVEQIAEVEEKFIAQTLDQRHKLMWLGVSLSCLIIIVLWIFSWRINFPSLSKESEPVDQISKFGEITDELADTIVEMKNSLAAISQAVAEAEANNEEANEGAGKREEEVTENLKAEVLDKLEEQKNSQDQEGEEPPIIIFE